MLSYESLARGRGCEGCRNELSGVLRIAGGNDMFPRVSRVQCLSGFYDAVIFLFNF